ncbi:uncharacterized protein Dana_GF20770 [Drosophila ananassae]|uniref:Uncharacterized protein n=1 Tax=Drosophila ananassae TaxID=7217 RepID=A0A0P8Y0J1_DROAN|nr:uncharacterized protein Dana_GF20770 [Drosophila ananassae]
MQELRHVFFKPPREISIVILWDSFISSQVHSQVKSFDCRLRITRECIRMPGICIANNNNNGLKNRTGAATTTFSGLRYADYGLRIAVRASRS